MTEQLLPVYRGDSKSIRVTFNDADAGVPYDITGATVLLTFTNSSNVVVITKTNTVHEDPTAGKTLFTVLPADTDDLIAGMKYKVCAVLMKDGEVITMPVATAPCLAPARELA